MFISWIRGSTGQLSLEIAPGYTDYSSWKTSPCSLSQSLIRLPSLGPDPEMSIICHLTLAQFREYCRYHLATNDSLPLDKFQLSAVVSLHGESVQEIACVPNLDIHEGAWGGDTMENGWSRMHSSLIDGSSVQILSTTTNYSLQDAWLSQANHVFSQLAIPPKHEDCLLVECITYWLTFSGPLQNIPEGYLFLCPLEDFQSNNGTRLATPECPAYWSFDPAGGSRLCPEDASNLGFPSLEFNMDVHVRSWHENVYAALSHFHAGKGFDPNSPDIARHLGYPIFELSCTPNVECAHIEEVSSDSLEAQPDPVLASCDALYTQSSRLMIGGLLGLIMACVATWLYCK
ncbi:hypothetical protein C8R44DRAFT_332464 [Mycena epipterygia]|nr:hypothetical protein C8R44DRAFT_332464 [Mycena epipterygia]